MDVVSDPVDYSPEVAAAQASAAVIADLSSSAKRDVIELQTVEKRTPGDCAKQPDGYGPKPATDSVDAFKALDVFHVRSCQSACRPNAYN